MSKRVWVCASVSSRSRAVSAGSKACDIGAINHVSDESEAIFDALTVLVRSVHILASHVSHLIGARTELPKLMQAFFGKLHF